MLIQDEIQEAQNTQKTEGHVDTVSDRATRPRPARARRPHRVRTKVAIAALAVGGAVGLATVIDGDVDTAPSNSGAALADVSHDTAETNRQQRLRPTTDVSHDTAETNRQQRLRPTTDGSHDTAETNRQQRLRHLP